MLRDIDHLAPCCNLTATELKTYAYQIFDMMIENNNTLSNPERLKSVLQSVATALSHSYLLYEVLPGGSSQYTFTRSVLGVTYGKNRSLLLANNTVNES